MWCWQWQPSQMLNVLSQAIWHTLLPLSRKIDACQVPTAESILMHPQQEIGGYSGSHYFLVLQHEL